MIFIDEAELLVRGGRGGNGCMAFRREKFVPRGGPSGGDGGHGGTVYLVGHAGLNTLYHLQHRSLCKAERGAHGEGSNRTGRSGDDLEIRVPPGTQVWDSEEETLLGEILEPGARLVVAQGGRGGRGNARFKTSTRRAPRRADPGEPGEERRLRLELRLLADVGLVGLPNAGKSTFIRSISAARPRVADYPFTTLVPELGVVAESPGVEPFVVADLPGLIRGAAEGAGLGHRFLRHVERCRVLAHLVDTASPDGGAAEALATTEGELRAFDPSLLERERLVVGTKLDAASDDQRAELRAAAADRDLPYFEVSSVTGAGVPALLAAIRQRVTAERSE